MGKKRNKKVYKDLFVVQLKAVPIDWALSDVVAALREKLKSIVAVNRVVDYAKQINDESVFVAVHDEVEYKALKEIRSVWIKNIEIPLQFMNWLLSSAKFPSDILIASRSDIEGLPINAQLSGLRSVSKVTTFYLLDVLYQLEISGDGVVGLTFLYDSRHDKVRPFGFATFLHRAAMIKRHNMLFTVNNDSIKCEAATTIPLVISLQNRQLIRDKPAPWSAELKIANWLTTDKETEAELTEDVAEPGYESDCSSALSLDLDFDIDMNYDIVKKRKRN